MVGAGDADGVAVDGKIKSVWRELEGIDRVSSDGEGNGSCSDVIDAWRYVWLSIFSNIERGLPVVVSHESSTP